MKARERALQAPWVPNILHHKSPKAFLRALCRSLLKVEGRISPTNGRHLLQVSSKRGLASWTPTVAAEIAALSKISWWYNWALSESADAAAAANAYGVEFVPMLVRATLIPYLTVQCRMVISQDIIIIWLVRVSYMGVQNRVHLTQGRCEGRA